MQPMQDQPATGEGRAPRLRIPALSCDCHCHVYEPGHAPHPGRETRRLAPASAYKRMLERLGFGRGIIVQPNYYGRDNSVTLEAIAALGIDRARGLAVISQEETPAELARLHERGVRGVRFSNGGDEFTFADAPAVAARIAPLGWHLQVPTFNEDAVSSVSDLPVDLVIDHLGRIEPEGGIDHPDFQAMLRFFQTGRAWIKISGPYYTSRSGPPLYEDFAERVRAVAAIRTDRLVWGSNWPHPTGAAHGEPEEADWLDALVDWIPDEADRHAILVDNPARLYGF